MVSNKTSYLRLHQSSQNTHTLALPPALCMHSLHTINTKCTQDLMEHSNCSDIHVYMYFVLTYMYFTLKETCIVCFLKCASMIVCRREGTRVAVSARTLSVSLPTVAESCRSKVEPNTSKQNRNHGNKEWRRLPTVRRVHTSTASTTAWAPATT